MFCAFEFLFTSSSTNHSSGGIACSIGGARIVVNPFLNRPRGEVSTTNFLVLMGGWVVLRFHDCCALLILGCDVI